MPVCPVSLLGQDLLCNFNAQVTVLLEETSGSHQSMLYAYMALMDISEKDRTLISQHLSSQAYRKVRLEVWADGTPG